MKKLFLMLALAAALMLSACAPEQPAPPAEEPMQEQEQAEQPPEEAPAPPAAHVLEGEWAWVDGDTYLYVFNADGTGSRGVSHLQEDFSWRTENERLYLTLLSVEEEWLFSVEGEYLTLNSVELAEMLFRYVRVEEEEAELTDHELLGTWLWDEGAEYFYIFNGDGTGQRGIPAMEEDFAWTVRGSDHLLMDTGIIEESWTFAVVDDVLTIESRQLEDTVFSYVRAE